MKAYQFIIALNDTNPLIWRRVIIPVHATFGVLHDVDKSVTSFQSGYPN